MNTNPGAEFAKIAALLNEGRIVRLTTNRGRVFEGELHTVGHASCYVGFAGRFAYGGIADIREVAG